MAMAAAPTMNNQDGDIIMEGDVVYCGTTIPGSNTTQQKHPKTTTSLRIKAVLTTKKFMIVQEVSASASVAFASSLLARRDEHNSRILVTIHVADMLGTDVVEDSNCFRIFECPQRGKQHKRCLIDHVVCVAPVPDSTSASNDNNNNNNNNNNGSSSSNRNRTTVSAQHWSDTVQEIASSQWQHKRKLLVLINPVGGVGNSTTLYTQYVRPVFQRCTGTIDYAQSTIRTTTHPQHATEIVLASSFASKSLNSTENATTPTTTTNNNNNKDNTVVYDCIVVVGGDGFVSEVIQGLVALSASRHRSNSSSSSSSDEDDSFDPLQIPIGIIPTGSGNGLANSLAAATPTTVHRSSCDPLSAAFAVAKGQPTGIDLASVRSAHHHVYAVLSIEWAFVANIDLESEHFRWLGSARFTMSAIKRIVWNSQQQWHGTFSYLPSHNDHNATTTTTKNNEHTDTKEHQQPRHQQDRYLVDDLLPPLDIRAVPKTWISVCGEFGFFWAISTSMASNDTVVCPQAKFDDGYMHCVYTQHRLSICEKIGVLLSIEDGSYLTKYSNKFTVVQTRAFQLIPSASASASKSKDTNTTTTNSNSNNASHDADNVMAIDGEVWKTTTTQVQVHRQLGTIMTL